MLIPLGFLGAGAAGNDFELINSQFLASNTASVTFNSIPATYKSLRLHISARGTVASNSDNLAFTVNGDSGSNYNTHSAFAYDNTFSSANSVSVGSMYLPSQLVAASAPANVYTSIVMDIVDYANTNKYKVFRSVLGAAPGAFLNPVSSIVSNEWMSASAITSITFGSSGLIAANSRFSLYGIRG